MSNPKAPSQPFDLATNTFVCETMPHMFANRGRRRKYPTWIFRYYIAANYILDQYRRTGRPLSILEVGIDRGQMLHYFRAALARHDIEFRQVVDRWIGVDVDASACVSSGYDQLLEVNIEQQVPEVKFDLCILLHVVEHLHEPELAVRALADASRPGSGFVIGVPCHLDLFTAGRERYLRAHTNSNGHVSAISRARIRRMAKATGLHLVDDRNAFALRATGAKFEDYAWCQALNLSLGKRLAGFPGEYYCHAVKAA